MVSTPTWLGATAGQPTQAGQVNQFLGSHTVQYLYAGTLKTAQTTPAGTYISVSSSGGYLAQAFTTASGQTAVGLIETITTGGGAGTTATFSIYASSGGAPTGSPLLTVTATSEYESFAPTWVTHPLPLTGLAPSTKYFIVAHSAASFSWRQSDQTSGAYTSSNGTTWTAQTYGLTFQVYDQTATGNLTCIWEDAGARWSWLNYSGSQVSQLSEYTLTQNGGYLQSDRNLSYSGSLLIAEA